MASTPVPVAVPDDLLRELKIAEKVTGLPRAEVMRESIKLGLPKLLEPYQAPAGLKPFTKEEARAAFGPDPYWDALEEKLARRQRHRREDA